MSSKFLFPKFFSGFSERFYNLLLFYFGKGALSFRYQLAQFRKVSFGFFQVLFHGVTIGLTVSQCGIGVNWK